MQEVLDKGEAYIKKIHASNDAIPGEVVSEKMSRMELFDKTDLCAGRTEPGSGDRYSQADGILSSDAVKLLEAYEEFGCTACAGGEYSFFEKGD